MKKLLELFNNKYFLWVVIVLAALGMFQTNSCNSKESKKQFEYNRQLKGQLSDSERLLQEANVKLGITDAQLLTVEDLNAELKKLQSKSDKEFAEFVKKHNLKVQSLDQTVFELRQKIKTGSSSTEVAETCNLDSKCIIQYQWSDWHKRFKLHDPNIFVEGDEAFEAVQLFKVFGSIFEQADGSLQIRRLELQEMYKNEKGRLALIPGTKAKIVSSSFKYHNAPVSVTGSDWKDMFSLRVIGVSTVTVFPNAGDSMLGMGVQFFHFKNAGISTFSVFNFNDIGNSEQRLGLNYSPNLFGLDLNLALGLSVGTPFSNAFKSYSTNIDLIFYLSN